MTATIRDGKTLVDYDAVPEDIYCTPCNRTFKSPRGLAQHNRHMHPDGIPLSTWRRMVEAQAEAADLDASLDNIIKEFLLLADDHVVDPTLGQGNLAVGYQQVSTGMTNYVYTPPQNSYQFESTSWLRNTQIACVPCEQKGCVLCGGTGYYDD